jgi:hypothetical protein
MQNGTELINITALAKLNHATTPVIRARLEKLGIKPEKEVEMPNGRKYVIFQKAAAIHALNEAKLQRQAEVEANFNGSKKEAVKNPQEDAKAPEVAALAAEVADMKELMRQLLEHFTRPHKAN